jgi:hypothetical protein
MFTDPIVAQIHQIRSDFTALVGDESHAMTVAAQTAREQLSNTFGIQWRRLAIKTKPTADIN